ncbi:MAG: DUF2283 domain-containing protein [Chloroflexota bacterium]
MGKKVNIYYDPEGDFLEVTFERKPGYMEDTDDERVMVRVDEDGNSIGLSIINVSKLKGLPFEVSLAS